MEIAKVLSVSYTQVRNWLRRESIPCRSGGKRDGIYYEDKSPKATRQVTPVDIAWAAGFIEGEGSFILRRRRKGFKRRSSFVGVPQVNLEPLFKLKEIFGGNLIPVKRKNKISVWRVYGARARGVAMTVYPFLSEKRKKQARRILR